jgi:SOS-response transcriptional repressor LexA
MRGDNIHDGDYVIVREQSNCIDGDIIVAVHMEGASEASATLKRFTRDTKRRTICLKPSNPEFPIIEIAQREWRQQWTIQGKVVAIFRKVDETARRRSKASL